MTSAFSWQSSVSLCPASFCTTLPASWEICKQVKKRVRTRHGTTNWLQVEEGLFEGYILSPYLFNLHAAYIMRNAKLDETQAGMMTAGRNSNNLKYADDTTLMAESKEELKSLLMKVEEESEKVGLKLNI